MPSGVCLLTQASMKKIGFLNFGHWTPSPSSKVRTAADSLLQSIELAVAAEELGADGAYFRVHHFARQLASPFPLLAAIGARTSRIEIGTGVIDMRYENPLYMAEDAGAADLIAGGRLQLGISRGSPEQVIDGWRYFGYQPAEGSRRRARWPASTPRCSSRSSRATASPSRTRGRCSPTRPGLLRVEPYSEGLRERIWWGASSNATAQWAASLGMNLMSSTLKDDENGKPFHVQQAEQIEAYRKAWAEAGWDREPRVSVSRSIMPIVTDEDRAYFWNRGDDADQIGYIDATTRAIFGRSYAAEPDVLVEQLAGDEAIAAADTVLLTVPNQLGVEYNAHLIETVLRDVAPGTGLALIVAPRRTASSVPNLVTLLLEIEEEGHQIAVKRSSRPSASRRRTRSPAAGRRRCATISSRRRSSRRVDVDPVRVTIPDRLEHRQQAADGRREVLVAGPVGAAADRRVDAHGPAPAARRRRTRRRASGPSAAPARRPRPAGASSSTSWSCSGASGNGVGRMRTDRSPGRRRSPPGRTRVASRRSRPTGSGRYISTQRPTTASNGALVEVEVAQVGAPRSARCATPAAATRSRGDGDRLGATSTPTTSPVGPTSSATQQGDVAGAAADVEHAHARRDPGGHEQLAGGGAVDLVLQHAAVRPRRRCGRGRRWRSSSSWASSVADAVVTGLERTRRFLGDTVSRLGPRNRVSARAFCGRRGRSQTVAARLRRAPAHRARAAPRAMSPAPTAAAVMLFEPVTGISPPVTTNGAEAVAPLVAPVAVIV